MLKAMRESMRGYTLTGLKTMNGRDGFIWQANIHKDGKKVCSVANDGNGGSDYFVYSSREAEEQFCADAKAAKPDEHFEVESMFAAHLADTHEAIKKIERTCKAKTVIQLLEDVDDQSYRIIPRIFSPTLAGMIRDRYGAELACIANEEL